MIRPETRLFDEFQSADFFLKGGVVTLLKFCLYSSFLFTDSFSVHVNNSEQHQNLGRNLELSSTALDCTLNKILYLLLVPLWVVRSIFHRSSCLFWWRPPWVDSPLSGCTWRWICRTCGTYFCPENTNERRVLPSNGFQSLQSNLVMTFDITFKECNGIFGPKLFVNYRPQRSCGKVMFLHMSVILYTGGGFWQADPLPAGRHSQTDTPWQAETPPGRQTPPPGRQTQPPW